MSDSPVILPGSTKNDKPMKTCSRCQQKKEPAGGIEMSPGKWRCASCWRSYNARK